MTDSTSSTQNANRRPQRLLQRDGPLSFRDPDFQDFEPVKLKPPPQIKRPKHNVMQDFKLAGPFNFIHPHHWRQRRNACVRTKYCPTGPPGTPNAIPMSSLPTIQFFTPESCKDEEFQRQLSTTVSPAETTWDEHDPYIVVGVMGINHPVPREVLMKITKSGTLFKRIHEAERYDRTFFRRLLSLKHTASFGIYECNPLRGYHTLVEVDHQTQLVLSEFFLDYNSGEPDYADRWLNWVQAELNQGNSNPADGIYALQLVLKWDPTKIVIWGSLAVIFSLIIGFWYQWQGGQFPGAQPSDQIGIVQTAWTIASFILTAAGVLLALLAAITSVGEV